LDIAGEDGDFVATRGVYSQNLNAKFSLKYKPYVLTVAKGAGGEKKTEGSRRPFITEINDFAPAKDELWCRDVEIETDAASESIETASIIVAGGRGVGSKAGMGQLNELAQALGGKIGATRPVALDGWIGVERMIGISGKITKPDLCIAIGASGSAPFLAGVRNCKTLVAINADPDASIFKYCDVGIVGDYRAVVSELMTLLKAG
jgi:electron transfer flavoprotein alpha subunit